MSNRSLLITAAGIATTLVLAGCAGDPGQSSPAAGSDSAVAVNVVASTNVYGNIAQQIGGDRVAVTSLIDSSAQDPHEYEASTQDQLALSKADIVIENGGGYDDFVDTLLSSAGNDDATVINVVDLSGLDAGGAGEFNEHVWYNFDAVDALADKLASAFANIDPEGSDAYTQQAGAFKDDLAAVSDQLAAIKADHAGEQVVITEPVPLYLLEAAGLENVTPAAFSEAVEEGTDVAPVTLKEVTDLIAGGDIALLAVNEQTGGPETDAVIEAADAAEVPVASFAETLPDGQDYIEWMTANAQQVHDALA